MFKFSNLKKKQKLKEKILLLCELFVTYKIIYLSFHCCLLKRLLTSFPDLVKLTCYSLLQTEVSFLVMQIAALCPTFGVCTDALVLIAG